MPTPPMAMNAMAMIPPTVRVPGWWFTVSSPWLMAGWWNVGGMVCFLCNFLGLRILPPTLPETNMAHENPWLEDEFPFGMAHN